MTFDLETSFLRRLVSAQPDVQTFSFLFPFLKSEDSFACNATTQTIMRTLEREASRSSLMLRRSSLDSSTTIENNQNTTDLLDPVPSSRGATSREAFKENNGPTAPPDSSQSTLTTAEEPRRIVVSQWNSEIMSLLVAAGCTIAMFTTLGGLQGQQPPRMPYDNVLNLSTLVALLATMFRSMLENVLSSGQHPHYTDSACPDTHLWWYRE